MQILIEIRKLRQFNRAAGISCLLLVVAMFIYMPLRLRSLSASRQPKEAQTDSWDSLRAAMDTFDYEKATTIAQHIAARFPSDYYPHAYLGNIALATGRIKDAETHYERACELLPSDENRKMLLAIQTRLLAEAAKR